MGCKQDLIPEKNTYKATTTSTMQTNSKDTNPSNSRFFFNLTIKNLCFLIVLKKTLGSFLTL